MLTLAVLCIGAPATARVQVLKDTLAGVEGQGAWPSYLNFNPLGADHSIVFQPVTFGEAVRISSVVVRGVHLGGNTLVSTDPLLSAYRVGFYSDARAAANPLAWDVAGVTVQPQVRTVRTLPNGWSYLEFAFAFASPLAVPAGRSNLSIWAETLPVTFGTPYLQTTVTPDAPAFRADSGTPGTVQSIGAPIGVRIEGAPVGAAAVPEAGAGWLSALGSAGAAGCHFHRLRRGRDTEARTLKSGLMPADK